MAKEKPVSKFDNKTYHFVQCNCPCNEMVKADLNYCLHCKHYHDPKPWHIMNEKEVQQAVATAKKGKKRETLPSPASVIKRMITKYRAKKVA